MTSVGTYRPEREVANADLTAGRGITPDWIERRAGILSRRFAGPDESVVDMAAGAAAAALRAARARPDDVDLVVLATCSMPSGLPNGAASVAARLGLTVPAFDVNAACAGFCYALTIADGLIRSGTSRSALVIGAEKMTDWIDPADTSTAVIFADGAAAVLVEASETPDVGPVVWGSDGDRADLITIPDRRAFMHLKGQAVYRWTRTTLMPYARRACDIAGVAPERLAAFVPHQANLRIIEALAQELGATNAVIARDVVEAGNTSAASIPLALAALIERGQVRPGDPVLLMGYGGGLTYATQVVRCPAVTAAYDAAALDGRDGIDARIGVVAAAPFDGTPAAADLDPAGVAVTRAA
jgi:3-oxoacyl-[acyl-carrier-protein] synthase-3